ncbi:hypothetical protein T4B_3467 [Trichinella pseudospiralis]|uniref:Uncharacterized protein n=1 Tax=Trichinella pseudospiralis TaxID=6337 RepID=A0A0V1H158_TRIPS|nr:hypothetical protein T4A_1680 [Trichinella pseudospiralis]KRY64764.1 hypothetical protein T4A_9537 [Trichinella pseudospiralis]KRY67181.1 hypothetical protein T4A_2172 [Trichinella pseudospiralis]KRZ04031.1 hypothetical protein T4B_3467 [Trichinella pseudospiralis]KRZ42876.1 hypothetical protein T4C_8135 [Trichinella pseudospiralis]
MSMPMKTVQSSESHHIYTKQNSVNVNIFPYNFSEKILRYNVISEEKLGCTTNNKRQNNEIRYGFHFEMTGITLF